MKKKGFTLVELLAVIVILAIVALISTPIILGVIETSRKRAFEDSGYGIVEAIKNYYIEDMQDGTVDYKTWTFPEAEGLKFEGMRPSGGNARLNGDGTIELAFHDNSFCATKGTTEDQIVVTKYEDGKCKLKESNLSSNYMEGTEKEKSQISEITFMDTRDVSKEAIESWDASEEKDGSVIAYLTEDKEREGYYKLYLGGYGKVYAPEYSQTLFYNYNNVTKIDVENLDTSKATSMWYMFSGCSSLTSLDLSNFNTSKVMNMSYMFDNCSKLTSLDLSSFDTSKVNEMDRMFIFCRSLISLDVSSFDTSKVTNMTYMFFDCSSLTSLDVSNFDTSKVTNMDSMFRSCKSLTSLDVSNFNTSKIMNMSYMFSDCHNLTSLDVSNFDTSKVTNMDSMFRSCKSLTSLDVSNFNTSKVMNMTYMFSDCSSLTSLDLSNFDTNNVTSMSRMFSKCPTDIQIKTNLATKDWILNLSSSSDRPSSWNDSNFIIV